MQGVRSSLTRIKNGLEKHLSDENDLFGYAGVNKAGILSFLEESYDLSHKLNELEPRFEIVVLKRKVAPLLETCRSFVESLENKKDTEKGFNNFLNALTGIRDQIISTYIQCVDKGIRAEAYAYELKEKIDEISDKFKETKEDFANIEKGLAGLDEVEPKIESFLKESQSASAQVQAILDQVQSSKNKIDATHTIVEKLEGEIKAKESEAKNISLKVVDAHKKAATLLKASEDTQQKIKANQEEIDRQLKENEATQIEISNTLAAANRVGMANSFKERKDELRSSLQIWGGVFVATAVGTFASGFIFIKPFLDKPNPDLLSLELFLKFLLVAPLVWLGWLSARQFGFVSRIREDYAYKFATAMAFEGYRKQAKEINDDLEEKLMKISVYHFSQNPIRLYSSQDNHASPLNEVLKDMISLSKEKFTQLIPGLKNPSNEKVINTPPKT
jgi:hypothetical protein